MWHAHKPMPKRVRLLLRTWCQQRRLSTAPPATMRAVRVFEPGPAETALNLSDQVSVPELKAGEVLVRNEFSGVNFHDTYTRSGLCAHSHSAQRLPSRTTVVSTRRSSLTIICLGINIESSLCPASDPRQCPFILGCEGGGTVIAIGPNEEHTADGPSIGDRVTYYCEGSYAEYSAVPAALAAAVPDGLAMDDAVALTVQGLTAHYLTRSTVELTPEHDIIVTAAAGGTGKLVVQMAKMMGARVLGLVSSEDKAAVAIAHGCDQTLIYRSPEGGGNVDFSGAAKEFSRTGEGVDVVYDSVGKATASFSLASLRPRGHCVFFGNASGAPDPIACVCPDQPPFTTSA